MDSREDLIHRFYQAFQKLDATAMNGCYSDNILFNDPVFGLLEGEEARAMWKMLCSQAKDFSLTYSDIRFSDDEYATCRWTAVYTFSKTGRKVVNNVKAHMKLREGKIVEHTDQFDLYRWCRQALGLPGWLFGWSFWMQNKVRKMAKASLEKYIGERAGSASSE